MPTRITQSKSPDGLATVLRVEGELFQDDAELLEKIALELRSADGDGIIVDLADVGLLDSDSAPILRRMADQHGFRLDGIETLLQTSIDTAERSGQ